MAYSHTLDLVQGDLNPQLTLTLRDSNKAALGRTLDPENKDTWATLNLTDGGVKLKLRMQGASELKEELIGALTDAPNGKVTFLFTNDTLDTVGTMEGEIEYTDAADRPQTVFDLIRIRVRQQF
jgi:hypothetical protein